MTGYALPAPRIGDEGTGLIVAGVLVSALVVGGILWWGHKKAQQTQQPQVATR